MHEEVVHFVLEDVIARKRAIVFVVEVRLAEIGQATPTGMGVQAAADRAVCSGGFRARAVRCAVT